MIEFVLNNASNQTGVCFDLGTKIFVNIRNSYFGFAAYIFVNSGNTQATFIKTHATARFHLVI